VTQPADPIVDFDLYLITDRRQVVGGDLIQTVESALYAGVKAIQLREKDVFSRELYELAFELRKLTSRFGARLLINDRVDIALAVEADGVHLGADSMPIHRVRRVLGPSKLIGVSCHNQISAITAQENGADFITFGPIFLTPSKARYGDPVGLEKLETVADLLDIPIFGLGGIHRDAIPQVLAAGAYGIALISAIIADEDPCNAATEILATMAASRLKTP
jgi:thiamine-phosphate pyrophosphorylase